ncbi:MAG: HlyD family efflux transporter periplasmic adaptor subunit, partial [Lachnospiraceae bacterium]|nr:HlyD family efflux transporter periplasmic adaptor subunit [Lachnospiraceae bacterium]
TDTDREDPSAETLAKIRDDCEKFTQTFSGDNFHDVYSLKYVLEGDLLNDALSARIGSGITSTSLTMGDRTVCVSPRDGIVCYSVDGYEGLDAGDISQDLFDEKGYRMTSLKSGRKIAAGDPVYRIIDSEEWSVCFPLTARQIVRMEDTSSVRVKFL